MAVLSLLMTRFSAYGSSKGGRCRAMFGVGAVAHLNFVGNGSVKTASACDAQVSQDKTSSLMRRTANDLEPKPVLHTTDTG